MFFLKTSFLEHAVQWRMQIPHAKPYLKELSVTPAWQQDEDLLIHLSKPSKKVFVSVISGIDSLNIH